MVDWTETRIAKLKLLHKEGLSGAAIAKKLGPAFTKGMVIGKLRRLELASKAAKSVNRRAKLTPDRRPMLTPVVGRTGVITAAELVGVARPR